MIERKTLAEILYFERMALSIFKELSAMNYGEWAEDAKAKRGKKAPFINDNTNIFSLVFYFLYELQQKTYITNNINDLLSWYREASGKYFQENIGEDDTREISNYLYELDNAEKNSPISEEELRVTLNRMAYHLLDAIFATINNDIPLTYTNKIYEIIRSSKVRSYVSKMYNEYIRLSYPKYPKILFDATPVVDRVLDSSFDKLEFQYIKFGFRRDLKRKDIFALYSYLLIGNYIDEHTDIYDLAYLITGKSLSADKTKPICNNRNGVPSRVYEPIVWTGGLHSLSYFIRVFRSGYNEKAIFNDATALFYSTEFENLGARAIAQKLSRKYKELECRADLVEKSFIDILKKTKEIWEKHRR